MSDEVLQKIITWYSWSLHEKGKTVKVAEGSVADAVDKLASLLPDFL